MSNVDQSCRACSVAFLSLLLGPFLTAQSLPILSSFVEDDVATSVKAVGLGDVDGDGADDFALNYRHPVPGAPFAVAFSAVLVSGQTGNPIVDYTASSVPSLVVDQIRECGDLDGDGRSEFLTLDSSAAAIRVHSGATLSVLFTLDLGGIPNVTLLRGAALGDLNGDGIGEVGLAYRWIFGPDNTFGQVVVFAGGTGSQLMTLASTNLQSTGIGNLGDLDADGVEDYFVSVVEGNGSLIGPYSAGEIRVLSGASGNVLTTISGAASEGLGFRAHSVRDLDADGRADVVSLSIGNGPFAGSQSAFVKAHSSSGGAVIWSRSFGPAVRVHDLEVAGDTNGDGNLDLIVTVQDALSFLFRRELISGQDGSFLSSLAGLSQGAAMPLPPSSEVFVGDLNDDGIADRLTHHVSSLGIVTALGHAVYGARQYGMGGPTQLSLDYVADPDRPRNGVCEVGNATPNAGLFLAASLDSDNTTIGGTSLSLLISLLPQDLIWTASYSADALGDLRLPLSLRFPSLAGHVLFLQCLETTPSLSTSNGLEILFGS